MNRQKLYIFIAVTIAVLFLLVGAARPQAVLVNQSFVDDATRSFRETRALRAQADAQTSEITALNTVNAAIREASTAKDGQIKAMQDRDDALVRLIDAQKQQIKDLAAIKCDTTTLFFVIKKKRCR